MLWNFALQKKTSRAVQYARTLKIKFLSPITAMDAELFLIPEDDPESLVYPQVSYAAWAAWRLYYPQLNEVSSESAVCLFFFFPFLTW
jgi:hypothetical protein